MTGDNKTTVEVCAKCGKPFTDLQVRMIDMPSEKKFHVTCTMEDMPQFAASMAEMQARRIWPFNQ
jgi:hypothetical protein